VNYRGRRKKKATSDHSAGVPWREDDAAEIDPAECQRYFVSAA